MPERSKGADLLTLSHAERIFLWSIRVWSASHRDPTVFWSCLEQVFAQEGMSCSLRPFHRFMEAVFSRLPEWPEIRCLHAAQLGEHEARLLSALAHLQNDDEAAARRTLKGWLHPACLRAVVLHGSACVTGAKVANVRFDSRAQSSASPLILRTSSAAGVHLH